MCTNLSRSLSVSHALTFTCTHAAGHVTTPACHVTTRTHWRECEMLAGTCLYSTEYMLVLAMPSYVCILLWPLKTDAENRWGKKKTEVTAANYNGLCYWVAIINVHNQRTPICIVFCRKWVALKMAGFKRRHGRQLCDVLVDADNASIRPSFYITNCM